MHYDATLGDMLFELLLHRYGYIGVKYPSGTNYKTSSTKEGDMNYTVFNDSDIKMKKKVGLVIVSPLFFCVFHIRYNIKLN